MTGGRNWRLQVGLEDVQGLYRRSIQIENNYSKHDDITAAQGKVTQWTANERKRCSGRNLLTSDGRGTLTSANRRKSVQQKEQLLHQPRQDSSCILNHCSCPARGRLPRWLHQDACEDGWTHPAHQDAASFWFIAFHTEGLRQRRVRT